MPSAATCAPSSSSLVASNAKCPASSAATSTQSSQNARYGTWPACFACSILSTYGEGIELSGYGEGIELSGYGEGIELSG